MQDLEVFQSLWAMERRRPDGVEWSLEEQFRMIAEAGFDGIGIDLAGGDVPTVDRAKKLLSDWGLGCQITAFPATVDDLRRTLETAAALDARMVVVNARYFPFTPEEGADFVHRCLEAGNSAGVSVYFETHRLTLTTDMLYTLQLLELAPQLELIADLSHFVVGREFPWPVDEQHDQWIDRILRRSAGFQGRVASREQIQIAMDFPQHQGWVELFYEWWTRGMRYWCDRNHENATLNFLCELGPPPYAITGADGYELSDRWLESHRIRDRIKSNWSRIQEARVRHPAD